MGLLIIALGWVPILLFTPILDGLMGIGLSHGATVALIWTAFGICEITGFVWGLANCSSPPKETL